MALRPHLQDTSPMDLFVDLASGWTCWVPRWTAEVEPAREQRVAAARRRDGGLLARLGAWLGAGGSCGHAFSARGPGA